MPKKKNLDLAAELGEEVDVTEEEANEARQIVAAEPEPAGAPVASTAPSTPTGPLTVSIADIQSIVKSAVEAATAGNAALAGAVTKGIADAREPIPENKFSPEVSVLNPLGDRAHPRPGLKCEMTLGTLDPKTKKVKETYPLVAADLTAYEQIALNTLDAQHVNVKLLDGDPLKVSIIPETDPVTDSLSKLIIAVPEQITAKGSQHKNMLPSITNLVEQITGINYAKLSAEDLVWFMAEHRAKRYVAVREAVAA